MRFFSAVWVLEIPLRFGRRASLRVLIVTDPFVQLLVFVVDELTSL